MKVYGIPNCNTVKKATEWLKQNNFNFEFHDFKKKGIDKEKLEEWSNIFTDEVVLNKKGLTWKKLSKEEQLKIDKRDKVIDYLSQNTSAIKRPIVEVNGKPVLISFNEDDYKKVLL
jgi:arsenate reductase